MKTAQISLMDELIVEFAEVRTRVEKYAPGADMKHWPEVVAV